MSENMHVSLVACLLRQMPQAALVDAAQSIPDLKSHDIVRSLADDSYDNPIQLGQAGRYLEAARLLQIVGNDILAGAASRVVETRGLDKACSRMTKEELHSVADLCREYVWRLPGIRLSFVAAMFGARTRCWRISQILTCLATELDWRSVGSLAPVRGNKDHAVCLPRTLSGDGQLPPPPPELKDMIDWALGNSEAVREYERQRASMVEQGSWNEWPGELPTPWLPLLQEHSERHRVRIELVWLAYRWYGTCLNMPIGPQKLDWKDIFARHAKNVRVPVATLYDVYGDPNLKPSQQMAKHFEARMRSHFGLA